MPAGEKAREALKSKNTAELVGIALSRDICYVVVRNNGSGRWRRRTHPTNKTKTGMGRGYDFVIDMRRRRLRSRSCSLLDKEPSVNEGRTEGGTREGNPKSRVKQTMY